MFTSVNVECLIGIDASSAEGGHQWLAMQEPVRVADGVNAMVIDFQSLGVEEVNILLFDIGNAYARTNNVIKVPAATINELHEVRNQVLILRSHLLDRDPRRIG